MTAADVIVIGGGIIGCSIAYRLAQEGVKVTVLERNARLGCEASGAAAGMLIAEGDPHTPKELLDLCLASRQLYPEFVEELKAESGMDIEYRQSGLLFLAFSDEEESKLEQYYELRKLQGSHVDKLSAAQVLTLEPRICKNVRLGLRFSAEQYVDNVRLMRALVVASSRLGVKFRVGSPVTGLLVENGKVVGVDVSGEKLIAGCVINAAGCWAGQIDGNVQPLPVKPARGQIVLVRSPEPIFKHLILSRRAYVAPRSDGRMLLGSTVEFAGFDKSITVEGIKGILEGALQISACLNQVPIARAWAGLRPYAQDQLPILGRSEIDGLIIATGHFRDGILLVPVTAKLITGLVITGKTPAELDKFSPGRFK